MTRVLLHPGFHKTGTSSLQHGAMDLAEELAPHLRVLFTQDVQEATRFAKRYSAYRDQADLERFAEAFTDVIDTLDPDDPRGVLITSEDLCGYIPGNHGVMAYDAAPALMHVAAAVLRARFGAGAKICVFFTTRMPIDWQRSVWWQNLRAMRLTLDFDTYREQLEVGARLDDIVDLVEDRIRTRATVVDAPIEDYGETALGPLGAALEQLNVSTADLPPLPARNVQPQGAAEELLALNRSDLSDDALAQAKRDVLRRFRAAGATQQRPNG